MALLYMKEYGPWATLLSDVATKWSWTENPHDKAQMKLYLQQDSTTLENIYHRVEDIFPTQVKTELTCFHATFGDVQRKVKADM